MSRRLTRPLPGLVLALGLLAPAFAWAGPPDWFASVYSQGGVEVRADERLFTLYAVLNAMGYDEAPVVRKAPLVKREFSPVRVRVRQAMATLDPKLKEQVSAFFDSHPVALSRYMAFTLQLGQAPSFSAPAGIQPAELLGFEKLLEKLYETAKIHELFAQVQDEYRSGTKGYLASIDAPLQAARKLLHDPVARAVVAVNDLDGKGEAQGVSVDSDAVLVLGPSPKPNLEAAVRAFARLVLDPVMAKKSASLKGAAEQAAVVRGSGGPALESGADFASELVARAIAIKVASTDPGADEEAALKLGFAGIKDVIKGLDDLAKGDKPLDASVPELLAKIDLKKPAQGK